MKLQTHAVPSAAAIISGEDMQQDISFLTIMYRQALDDHYVKDASALAALVTAAQERRRHHGG